MPRNQGPVRRPGGEPAPARLQGQVRGGVLPEPTPVPCMPSVERLVPEGLPMKSQNPSVYSLPWPSGDGYSEVRAASLTNAADAKENGREGADQIPARQPLSRFPG